MKRKLLLGLGGVSVLALPMALAISCKDESSTHTATISAPVHYSFDTSVIYTQANRSLDRIQQNLNTKYFGTTMSYYTQSSYYGSSSSRWSGLSDDIGSKSSTIVELDTELVINYEYSLNNNSSVAPFYVVDVNSAKLVMPDVNQATVAKKITRQVLDSIHVTIGAITNASDVQLSSKVATDFSAMWEEAKNNDFSFVIEAIASQVSQFEATELPEVVTVLNTREEINDFNAGIQPINIDFGEMIENELTPWEFDGTKAMVRSKVFISNPKFRQ